MSTLTLIIRTLTVAMAHVAIGFWLYRSRALDKGEIFKSEFLVFFLPTILALVVYAYVFWFYGFAPSNIWFRVSATIFFSILAIFLSLWLLMVIGANLYGT